MMRVLHILKVKGIAGAEQHLLTLLPGLRARGVDARFLILVPPDNPVIDFTVAADARGIPLEKLIIRHHADITLYGQLLSKIREFNPDVVHTHLQHGDLYGIPAARWAGVPVVITSRHNDDVRRRNRALRWLNRWLWGQVSAGIGISEAIRQFSVDVEGAPSDRVVTIHYGIEASEQKREGRTARQQLRSRLDLDQDALLAGMVCRLIPLKGVAYVIDALALLKESIPNLHLVIAGDGPQRSSLVQQVESNGLRGRVHFLGWRQDIPDVMAGFDALVVASEREGFGLVMLEAMAQAIPVIGTDVSAIPEVIVHGETGLLVPSKDVPGMAEALQYTFSDRALRQYMGLMGQDRLETSFSAARMVDATAALYNHLLTMKQQT
ncbi:MAG TPA: glycosyltransferase family 4 protein [Aggregatilineales bacterium]|nr:glycosyltransferase family 4 protein [Aggregatilineales bacterium]